MKKVFIDFDVLLDFAFDREPFSEYAAKLFMLSENKEIEVYTSAVIICNVYYVLNKHSGRKKSMETIKLILKLVDILNIDKKTMMDAVDSNFSDFEDAVQNFTAQNSSVVDVLATRNKADYKNSKLIIKTPKEYLIDYKNSI